MWPIPILENDIITISFSDENLVLCWIERNSAHNNFLTLKAYERHQLHHLEIENLILFNPTKIKNIIVTFLSVYKKNNAFISISLDGVGLLEQFITLSTSTPQLTDFGISSTGNFLWGYRFMYQNSDGQSIFYVYKISRSLLLQYQLLAIGAHLNLMSITAQKMALFSLYKTALGTTFRQSTFFVDMTHHNNVIQDLVSVETITKIMTIPSAISIVDELPHLAVSCGLFTYQGLLL